MRILGIDPGKTGGLAILEIRNGSVNGLVTIPMPIMGKEIDLIGIVAWIRNIFPYGPLSDCLDFSVIEKVGRNPKWGAKNFDFGFSAGSIQGLLIGLGIPIRLVHPRIWKKIVLAGTKMDKNAAINHVRKAYPHIDIFPGKSKKPHEGITESICIAEWGWITFAEK